MRGGIRAVLISGKICMSVLLGVAISEMVIPGSDAAFNHTSTQTVAQAPLFTVIDLTPSGFTHSKAFSTAAGQQVGYGIPGMGGVHALLWHGSAASVADLNPPGFAQSEALAASGEQQVGWGLTVNFREHALLWRGSADSAVDLHPSGFEGSQALGTDGEQQVGTGWDEATGGHKLHALLWHGSPASVVDLHPIGFIPVWSRRHLRRAAGGVGRWSGDWGQEPCAVVAR